MDSDNVTIVLSWIGPSRRNGSYNYTVTYSGDQVEDYPEERRESHPETTVVLDGNNMDLQIIGLPYANYTVNVTAFNIRTGRPGPSTTLENRTIPTSKIIIIVMI